MATKIPEIPSTSGDPQEDFERSFYRTTYDSPPLSSAEKRAIGNAVIKVSAAAIVIAVANHLRPKKR